MSARDFVIRRAPRHEAGEPIADAPTRPVEKGEAIALPRGWVGLEGAIHAEFRAFGVVAINERPRAEARHWGSR